MGGEDCRLLFSSSDPVTTLFDSRSNSISNRDISEALVQNPYEGQLSKGVAAGFGSRGAEGRAANELKGSRYKVTDTGLGEGPSGDHPLVLLTGADVISLGSIAEWLAKEDIVPAYAGAEGLKALKLQLDELREGVRARLANQDGVAGSKEPKTRWQNP